MAYAGGAGAYPARGVSALAVKLETETRTVRLCGKERKVTATWYLGLCAYRRLDGAEVLADWAQYVEIEGLGGGWSYAMRGAHTPEELEQARRRTVEAAQRAMSAQGIW